MGRVVMAWDMNRVRRLRIPSDRRVPAAAPALTERPRAVWPEDNVLALESAELREDTGARSGDCSGRFELGVSAAWMVEVDGVCVLGTTPSMKGKDGCWTRSSVVIFGSCINDLTPMKIHGTIASASSAPARVLGFVLRTAGN